MYYCVLINDDHSFREYQNKIAKALGVRPDVPWGVVHQALDRAEDGVLDDVFYTYQSFDALKEAFKHTAIGVKSAEGVRDIEYEYQLAHPDSVLSIFNSAYEAVISVWHR